MSLQKYLYAAADPVNKIDPSGEQFALGTFLVSVSISGILNSIARPSYAGIQKVIKCDAKLPERPVFEVAATCFGEASNDCPEGSREKKAITDCVYNRVKGRIRSDWCNKNRDVWDVVACPYQFDGFLNDQYVKVVEGWWNFGTAACNKLKDCISAAEASAKGTGNKFNGFNQTYAFGRTKICKHYFRTE